MTSQSACPLETFILNCSYKGSLNLIRLSQMMMYILGISDKKSKFKITIIHHSYEDQSVAATDEYIINVVVTLLQ